MREKDPAEHGILRMSGKSFWVSSTGLSCQEVKPDEYEMPLSARVLEKHRERHGCNYKAVMHRKVQELVATSHGSTLKNHNLLKEDLAKSARIVKFD